MKVVRIRRGIRSSKPKLLCDIKNVGVSWTNDTRDGAETFSISSMGGTDYDYRIELSREEVMRLYNYAGPRRCE